MFLDFRPLLCTYVLSLLSNRRTTNVLWWWWWWWWWWWCIDYIIAVCWWCVISLGERLRCISLRCHVLMGVFIDEHNYKSPSPLFSHWRLDIYRYHCRLFVIPVTMYAELPQLFYIYFVSWFIILIKCSRHHRSACLRHDACVLLQWRSRRTYRTSLTGYSAFLKLKFHWDQFPRNFLADLLATSPTSS